MHTLYNTVLWWKAWTTIGYNSTSQTIVWLNTNMRYYIVSLHSQTHKNANMQLLTFLEPTYVSTQESGQTISLSLNTLESQIQL